MAGRNDLIGSALVQMMDMDVSPQTWSPSDLIDRAALEGIPHHGIGRGFKVGKEEIAGLLTALQGFVERDEAAAGTAFRQRLLRIAAVLGTESPIKTRLLAADGDLFSGIPLLELTVTGSAHALCRRLLNGNPPVHLGERQADAGILTIHPQTLRPQDDAVLTRCLIDATRSPT